MNKSYQLIRIDSFSSDKLNHSVAEDYLKNAGIFLQSTGNCSNPNFRNCTSLVSFN